MSVLSPTHKYWFVDKEDNGTNMHKYAFVTNETKSLGLLDLNPTLSHQSYSIFERTKQLQIKTKINMQELMTWLKRVKYHFNRIIYIPDLDLCTEWIVRKNTRFKLCSLLELVSSFAR
jgi:hypothetical protein